MLDDTVEEKAPAWRSFPFQVPEPFQYSYGETVTWTGKKGDKTGLVVGEYVLSMPLPSWQGGEPALTHVCVVNPSDSYELKHIPASSLRRAGYYYR